LNHQTLKHFHSKQHGIRATKPPLPLTLWPPPTDYKDFESWFSGCRSCPAPMTLFPVSRHQINVAWSRERQGSTYPPSATILAYSPVLTPPLLHP